MSDYARNLLLKLRAKGSPDFQAAFDARFAGASVMQPGRGPLVRKIFSQRPTAQPGQNPLEPFADPGSSRCGAPGTRCGSDSSNPYSPPPENFVPTVNDKPGGGIPGTGRIPSLPTWGTVINWGTRWVQDQLNPQQEAQCAPGRIKVGNQCVDPGAALPGGTPLTVPAGGQAVMGVFGVPSVSPVVVGEITSSNGATSVVRRCPTGLVLGKDNMCYAKGSIPNNLRKWPKAPRPPVSAFDARMMNKYGPKGSKRAGVKKLAQAAGFSCSTGTVRRKK